ncbi:MAG: prepilin peptidase, partial [Alphaproteobacteria bacterium]|nr:prepilin peptidase [Alphaproteobacteria bacterium]
LIEAAVAAADSSAASVLHAVQRGTALALAFWLFRLVYRRLRGRDGIGLGDVKLAAVAGLWLDWIAIAVAVDIAALSALAVVLVQAARGRKISVTTRIPFGLFFAPAIWLAWLIERLFLRGAF